MVERKAGQLPCAFNSSIICPPDCNLNSFRQKMHSIYDPPAGMVSDVLNEREDYVKYCGQREKPVPQMSSLEALKVTLQKYLNIV